MPKSMSKQSRYRYVHCSSEDDATNTKDNVPERILNDLYCRLCDSHMNSKEMWMQHVAGKRHLKNLQKPPGVKPSKVKAVPSNAIPKVQEMIDAIEEPVVGLSYTCEIRQADPTMDPLYKCYLCQGQFSVMTIIDHLLSDKHRWNYLKLKSKNFQLMDKLRLNKNQINDVIYQNVLELERELGRGTMQVKIKKVCGMVPHAYSLSSPQPSYSQNGRLFSSRSSKSSSRLSRLSTSLSRHSSRSSRHSSRSNRYSSRSSRHSSRLNRHLSRLGRYSSRSIRHLSRSSRHSSRLSRHSSRLSRHSSRSGRYSSKSIKHSSMSSRHSSQISRHSSQISRHSSQISRHSSQISRHSSQISRHSSRSSRYSSRSSRHSSRSSRHSSRSSRHSSKLVARESKLSSKRLEEASTWRLPLSTPSTSSRSTPTPSPTTKLDLKKHARHFTCEQWNYILKTIEEDVVQNPELFRSNEEKLNHLARCIISNTVKHLTVQYQKCTTERKETFMKYINEENLPRHWDKEM